jgi:pimeloyl-ACP methyl ester carboxylesterase
MGGRRTSTGIDRLARTIEQNGLAASVYDYLSWRNAADEAIRQYQQAGTTAVIVIGHSAGGDAAIRFAQLLNAAGLPVRLLVTFDPTRVAPRIPGNVERYLNVYQSWNFIGGGDPSPASNFHGDFASIDLKDWNVLHVNVPKISGLQAAVAAKIVQVASTPSLNDPSAVPIEYAIPRNEPIELWDSGLPVRAQDGDTVSSIAAKYSVPVWVIAEVNRISPSTSLDSGKSLIIPHHVQGGT